MNRDAVDPGSTPGAADAAHPQPVVSEDADAALPVSQATFEAGNANVQLKVSLPPGTSLRITFETVQGDDGTPTVVAYTTSSPSGVTEQTAALPAGERTAASVYSPAVLSVNAELPTAYPGELPARARIERLSKPWSRAVLDFLELAAVRPAWLMAGGIGIYLLVRLAALPAFPVYFFTDEAIQTLLAADFLRDQFQNYAKDIFPTYFINGGQYNLGLSVYLQVIPYLLFGSSIWLTRGVPALVSLLAGLSLSFAMQRVYKSQFAWLGILVLSITPAWFLHSRTAFETSLATTFFAVFLYAYLMYRTQSPKHLYLAVGAGWLCFYSYSPAQVVIGVAGILLLLVDLPYHWRNRGVVFKAAGLLLLGALPYIRFQITHPGESGTHLRILGSYWIASIPLLEKIGRYLQEYLQGLNPLYWYLPNQQDLPRHIMKDYGHLLRLFMPFTVIGLYQVIRRLRKAEYRVLLIALLAAPSGAAVVRIGITRALFMVAPVALVTALGIESSLTWLQARLKAWLGSLQKPAAGSPSFRLLSSLQRLPQTWLGLVVFFLLAAGNLYMLGDALIKGPTWFRDYGLNGMQWGARQVFAEIDETLRQQPEAQILLSPAWANGTDTVARFFYPDPMPFSLGNIDTYINEYRLFDDRMVFVMIPEEYARIPQTKFTDIHVDKVLPYPDGRPGFYFVRMRYVDDIKAVFENEIVERRQLLEDELILPDGSQVALRYSRLDMGRIIDAVDGNPDTVVRTLEANPLKIEVAFQEPRELNGVSLRIGGTATRVVVQVKAVGVDHEVKYETSLPEAVMLRNLPVPFDTLMQVERLSIAVFNANDGQQAHVHLWEIYFD